jgi:hypothetical protein
MLGVIVSRSLDRQPEVPDREGECKNCNREGGKSRQSIFSCSPEEQLRDDRVGGAGYQHDEDWKAPRERGALG